MGAIRRGRARLLALVPFGLQKRLLAVLAWLVQRLVRSPSIGYRGHRVYLLPNDPSTARILVSNFYWRGWHHEAGAQALVERIIEARAGRVFFVDGGASFGMYSFLAASLSAVEKVIAVEASPLTFAQLRRSSSESTLSARIDCRHAALTDTTTRVLSLAAGIDASEWHQVTTSGTTENTIPALTIDSLVTDLALRPGDTLFVKLDIEGSGVDAVLGMRGTLAQDRDTLLMLEFHTALLNRQPDGARNFARMLFELGMQSIYVMDDTQPRLWQVATLDDMLSFTERLTRASFPNNLCNLLLVKRGLGTAPNVIQVQPLAAAI